MKIVRAHQETAPVKVSPIVRALGLQAFSADLPHGVSGKIFFEEPEDGSQSGYVIYVNGGEPKPRMRFTLAHEVAHFILHRDLIGDGISDDVLYRSKLSSPIEAAANKLAADILMPWHLVREATDKGITTASDLARLFEVSEIAMSIRLGLPT
jgi:hypothetical protein